MPSKFSESTINNIKNTRLFANCGKGLAPNDLGPLQQVDRKVAMKLGRSDEWDYFSQERSGDLTVHLMKKDQNERDRNWNPYVKEFRRIWDSELQEHVTSCMKLASIDQDQLESIRWSLLNYVMTESFSNYNPPDFFRRVGLLFLSGLYPCSAKNTPENSITIMIY